MGAAVAVPFLWGPKINLLANVRDSYVTALSNGTFLVIGMTDVATANIKMRAWIYNADGSLREETIVESPAYGHPFGERPLTYSASSPFAVELPDGRIALPWSIATSAPGHFGAWLGLYGSDLQPLGKPFPIAGLETDPRSVSGHFKADDAIGLADGSVITVFRSLGGEAFVRVLKPDGILSNPLRLGTTLGSDLSSGFGSVADLATLPDGKVAAVLRTSAAENKVYVLDPSAVGGPIVLKEFSIPVVSEPDMMPIEVTALEGDRFVVTWIEKGKISQSGTEPEITVKFQVYDSEGAKTGPLAFYASSGEAESVSNPDVVALPGGGFALAAQVLTSKSENSSEVRLAIFDAAGTRISEKLLVSTPAAGDLISLDGLSPMADGRIAAHLSSGIQIVDPRDKAISLKGTAGNDHYIGTAFHDTFEGNAGADKLEGGFGIDFVSFVNAKAGVTASLSGGTRGDAVGDTYISIEGLLGSSFDDVLIGNGSATLKGRGGNDIYYIKTGDVFEEAVNEGLDTVIVGSSYTLKEDAQIEVLRLENVSSKTSAHLTGSNIDNDIIGHGGTNTLKGLAGNDLVKASSGNDRVEGGRGSDTLYGGSGNDKLYGGTGTGKDVFVFDTALSRTKNVDQIYDFNPKYDSIQLENKIFTKLGKGSIKGVKFKSDMFVKSTQAQDREDRIVYDSKAGALYYDKDGTGSAAQVKIATLSKNLKLTASDFFVI